MLNLINYRIENKGFVQIEKGPGEAAEALIRIGHVLNGGHRLTTTYAPVDYFAFLGFTLVDTMTSPDGRLWT
jgi:hypothetical protein